MQRQTRKKVLLTGGHAATTAIATIEEIVRRESKNNWDLYWIGAKWAMEGKKVRTLESSVLPKLGVKHFNITTGRIQTRFTLWTIPSLSKIPIGFIHALFLLIKIKPDLILSFGGYSAFPVVAVGNILNIPIVIHDQTIAVSRSNKYASRFANKIALARTSAAKHFSKNKSIVLGNPVMTQIAEIKAKAKKGIPATIFIVGGSRGSQSINEIVFKIIPKLVKKYLVIHLTGSLDFEVAKKVKNDLDKKFRSRYEVYDVIDPMQIDGLYKQADLIISRSGANTVSEIIITKRPAILIPLPHSINNEQKKNALYAKKFGIAVVIEQENLNESNLYSKIGYTDNNWENIVSKVKDKESPDINASEKLVDLLEKTIK